MKYLYIIWLNAFAESLPMAGTYHVTKQGSDSSLSIATSTTSFLPTIIVHVRSFGFEGMLDKDTVVEGEPFTISCSYRHLNGTVKCQSFASLTIFMNRRKILEIGWFQSVPNVYYPQDGNWKSTCNMGDYEFQTYCKIFVKQAQMYHQGVYSCSFLGRSIQGCANHGHAILKVIKETTSLKTTETQSSNDVSGSLHSEKRFSTTASPSVMNTTELQVTDESLDISLKVLIATATFVAMLGEVSFFTIAWIFWRKARSMAVIRNLFQNTDQPSPKTAISQKANSEITSLGSDITDRCTQTTPDAVLDQHADLHPQPISRTELVYLAAQKTPGQELIDRTDLMSGISGISGAKNAHQGMGRSMKII